MAGAFLAGGATLLVLAPMHLAAAEIVLPKADEAMVAEELKTPEDPTILKRRVWLDTEWNHFRQSGDDLDFTFGNLWSWAASSSQDWAVRINVPIRTHFAGDSPGDEKKQGVGDVKFAAGAAVRLSNTWRAGGGLEMRFPTASDNLGANVWRPQLFGAIAWDVTPRITLSPSAEYNKSIAERRGAAPQHFLEMFFPATFLLEPRWAVTPRYEVKIDFANNVKLTHSGKLSITKELKDRPLALTFSIKKMFDGGENRFQVNFVATQFFR